MDGSNGLWGLYGQAMGGELLESLKADLPEIAACGGLALVVFGALAYAIRKLRPKPVENEGSANEMMTVFREAHHRGQLSDEEYRAIKGELTERLQRELNGKDETG